MVGSPRLEQEVEQRSQGMDGAHAIILLRLNAITSRLML
jgi:hypothetical protein